MMFWHTKSILLSHYFDVVCSIRLKRKNEWFYVWTREEEVSKHLVNFLDVCHSKTRHAEQDHLRL